MSEPTIEDVKAIQRERDLLDVHVAWIGPASFVVAHTDEERATIGLETCDFHQWLSGLDCAPQDVGYYVVVPHMPDADSEPYGAEPWDFHPLSEVPA